jgi:hypothetical protein
LAFKFESHPSRKTIINSRPHRKRAEFACYGVAGMIKHIVMFKLKEAAEGNDKAENMKRMKSMLEALPAKIKEIKFFKVGVNFSDVPVAYDLVLNSEFESKEALYSYQKNPDHVQVANFVGKVCENRAVVDYVF